MPSDTSSNRPLIVVLVGLPASGKSTWVRQQGTAVLSSDETRYLLADDPTNQEIHAIVFGAIRYLLKRRLELRRPVSYVDATNLTKRDRRPYIKLSQLFDARVEAVVFDTPLEVCQERNRQRSRVVPDEAIAAMALRMTMPTVEEGFDAVTIYQPTAAVPPTMQRLAPVPKEP